MTTLSPTYYKVMFERKNVVKEKLLLLFLSIAPFFRMVPEVFLRRKMGRRYFNFSIAIFYALVLALAPIIFASVGFHSPSWYEVVWANIFYYVFLSAYVFQCYMRRKDVKRIKSVFDFEEYTKSNGLVHPKLMEIEDKFGDINYRLIETTIEPLIILVSGLVCLMFSKVLGLFLIFCAVVYCLSYSAQYYLGDEMIMKSIDEQIVGQELERIMIDGHSKSGNRGVRYYGTRPSSPNLRQQLWNRMTRKNKGNGNDDEGDNGVAV